MFGSPFGNQSKIVIPDDVDIVFVADMFKEDYVGGAELTTEALITSSPLNIFKLHSKDVNLETLETGHEKYWVFGNYSSMDMEMIPTIAANMNYSILEYDYKFCRYRSPEKHETAEGTACACNDEMHGKMISSFMYGAKSLWWMSESQREIYIERFPFLDEKENVVLSSVFDDTFFLSVKMLNEKYKDHERSGWLVLGSTSWIKGTDAAKEWCESNNKDHEVILGWPYEKVLEEMAKAEGFVYLPPGGDTCPRMVIEAKLLGCELHLNDNVQHAKEIWFDTDDRFDTEAYLFAARERFWSSIMATMNYIPTISGYTTTLNCLRHQYPWKQSVGSMLEFCHEVVVVDGGSDDGTWEDLTKWAESEPRLKVHQSARDWDHPRFAVFDGDQKAVARSLCSGEFCWQQDADEVVHEDDYQKVYQLCRNFPSQADLISLPVIEYWGSEQKVRMDINPWKWRLSRNKENITHGIPTALRRFDEDNNLYSLPGTDGCDYVHNETYEPIPHASFYSQEIHNLKIETLNGNAEAFNKYQEWFNRVVEMLPSIHHYSWIDIPRKIRTYRDYWSQHWQSLYDISQDDTAENNMFFNKSWAEVTEEEIVTMGNELAEKMGGWVFHSKVDFSKPTPHVSIDREQPKIMQED